MKWVLGLELFLNTLSHIRRDRYNMVVNYLKDSEDEAHLDNILLTYNLISIINFPTRVQNASCTAIDNFFIDVSQF
jgi:hypothetical protein